MATIKLNNGIKTYSIEDQDGNILGSVSFNPSDTQVIERYNKAVAEYNLLPEELQRLKTASSVEKMEFLNKKAADLIDRVFGANISQTFFSIMGPFSPLDNGQYFVENVLEGLGKAFEESTGERVNKVNAKIKKHTSKYHG